MQAMDPPQFAEVVRQLMHAAAAAGMRMPGFVSPPRTKGARRTIRWLAEDRALVAVRRDTDAVVTDMIDGVVAANRLSGSAAEDAARKLRSAIGAINTVPSGGH
jgi:hypothetical protein